MRSRGVFQKIGPLLVAIVLCGLVNAPGIALADDIRAPSEKDETVYVYTDADGSVKCAEVTTILKNPDGADELVDSTTLTDIKGKDGESFTGSDGSIVWEAGGENVTYTGGTSAEIPVSMHVSYTLDGQPISPDELAGKTGRITIRYDFENNSSFTAAVNGSFQTVYTPFTCVTALMFDGRDFKNIVVENGKVVADGDDTIVVGYAMPGLKQSLGSMAKDANVPDHFTVTADVTNFELKSTMTIVTAGLMSDLDMSGLGLGDLDNASALTDAMGQLISGSDTLTTGLNELASNVKQLEAGAASMQEGAQALSGGLAALSGEDGLEGLATGASGLAGGMDLLGESLTSMKEELAKAKQELDGQIPPSDPFAAAQVVLDAEKDNISAEHYAALAQTLAAGSQMYGSLLTISTKLGIAADALDAMKGKVEEAKQGASALASGATEAAEGAGALAEVADALEEGTVQLNNSMPKLIEGLKAAAEGSKTLTDGMRTFNDQGVSKLVDTLKNDYGGMLDRMNALSDAAKSFTNFAGITDGTAGTVKFVFETDAITKAS